MKKYILILLVSVAGVFVSSCSLTGEEEDGPVAGGKLSLTLSTSVIQANGEDAAVFEVRMGDEVLAEGVAIYDGVTNTQVDLPEMKFATEKAGTYSFWAAYGTEQSNTVTLTAVDFAVPELPEDPYPSETSFNKRALITQFTGTGCGYCPFMINILRNFAAKPEYSSKFVLAAAHTYNQNDPAFLSTPLDQAMGVSGYPMVVFDMYSNFNDYRSQSAFEMAFDKAYSRSEALAGISANSYLEGGTLVVRMAVKAAAEGEYRVGAWLLEDGIKAKQTNGGADGNFDVHDNCIRVADSRVSSSNFTGHSVGSLKKGGIGQHVFAIKVDEDKWKKENFHLVLFVTVKEKGGFTVTNAIDCDLNEQVAFEYAR